MSTLKIDSNWIVGEPLKGSLLSSQVIQWVRENTGWEPSTEAQADMDKLLDEITTKYEHGSEGYYAFGSQIIDSTLSRIYPFLAKWANENNKKIDAGRKEELIDGVQRILIYTISAAPKEEEPALEGEEEEPDIPDNPFPLDPALDDSPVLPNEELQYNPLPPSWPGLPYNPLNPTGREPTPYLERQEQPDIPFDPSRDKIPELPSTGTEIPLPGQPETPEPGEEEPEPVEETPEPVEETPEPGEDRTSKIEEILLAILQEIIRQGTLNRNAIADAVGALQGEIAKSSQSIQDSISAAEKLISDAIGAQSVMQFSLLTQITDILEETYEKIEKAQVEPQTLLSDAIESAGEFVSDTLDAMGGLLGAALDGITAGLSAIESVLSAGLDFLTDAISAGFASLVEMYEKAQQVLFAWIENAVSVEPEEINKYFCQFLSSLSSIKDECSWLRERSE